MPSLHLLQFLLLSFLLDWKSGTAAYRGVQHNVTISELLGIGCSICHDRGSERTTRSEDIMSCRGPYLFVGLRSPTTSLVEIGAFAPAVVVLEKTAVNAFHSHDGVGWHFSPGNSFGFLRNLATDSAHSFDSMNLNNPSRMIWSIDNFHGQDSSGTSHGILSAPSRMIFNCPAGQILLPPVIYAKYTTF